MPSALRLAMTLLVQEPLGFELTLRPSVSLGDHSILRAS